MRWAAVLLAALLSGCTMPWVKDPVGVTPPTTVTTPTPVDIGPPLVFGGTVVDALTNGTMRDAEVRIDLAYVQPCRREGLMWAAWPATTDAEGRFGPIEIPRPRSDDVAFFVHAGREGYADASMYVGPQEARGDLGNLTLTLHPDMALRGTAPPGTVVALATPGFPRLTVADEAGNWSFPQAPVTGTQLVVATAPPQHRVARAPEDVVVEPGNATAWRVEGATRDERGAPVQADLVAWVGDRLAGAARSGRSGDYALDLAAEPQQVRIVAQTEDGRLGTTRVLDLTGPPALREALVLRPLC